MKMTFLDLDRWEEIFQTLRRNRSRSLLTAFGIFWGIFMLVIMMGGSQGLKALLSKNFEGFATNAVFFVSQTTSKPYHGFQKNREWELEINDVERIRSLIPEVERITGTTGKWGMEAACGEKTTSVSVMKGLIPEHAHIEQPELKYGRYINQTDLNEMRKVCIIGKRIYEELFPMGGDPCGTFIRIGQIYYQVIGVDVNDRKINLGGDAEKSVIIPMSVMQREYNYGKKIDIISLTIKSGYSVDEVSERVEQVIKQQHHIHPNDKQAMMRLNTSAMFSMVDGLFTGINILGLMVGLGTLLAGAIGVTNIMMVTVKERTAEIGIRRAIGAKPRQIMSQILSESIVLTLLAGMMGLMLSIFILQIVEQASDAGFQISFWRAIEAGLALVVFGLLAGLSPAFRAMSIKPIDALRDE